jgi:putative tryptophan/tyrosine transport system substrate-binding protein
MRRREFIAVLGGAAVAGLRVTAAQEPAKVWRVGWIWTGPSTGNPDEVAGFRQGLKDFGYVEGQNIVVEYRFAEGRPDRVAGLIAELVRLQPDVLVVVGTQVVIALKRETTGIPVVSMSGDPVGAGLVPSLARPGGNITGVSMMQGIEGLTAKRVELLKDALPGATRIGMIFNPDVVSAVTGLAQAEQAATQLGLTLRPSPVRYGYEIAEAVATLAHDGVDGAHVDPTPPLLDKQLEIAELLLKFRIPAISELRLLIQAGGLLSYGPNLFEATRRMAYFMDRILKGAKPADLPMEQPAKFDLVVNLTTARALGIEIPRTFLARADEVIE